MMKALVALLSHIIDAIAPLRERTRRVRTTDAEDLALSPTVHDLLGTRITTLMNYESGGSAALIQSLKYDGSARAARLLASALADFLREEVASHRTFSTKTLLLVPVPLHPSRGRERGFNQIQKVLDHLPLEFRDGSLSFVNSETLERTRSTLPQTKLARSERLSNVAGAFACHDEDTIRDTHIFLIDDVTTTGATLVNAATPLRRAGATVTCLALARA
ncbi:MAG TPA: hypothetical protein VJL39_00630 [Candidatus Paceibacterota bacterium]